MGRGKCGISFAETGQILLEGTHAFSSPSSVRRVTGTLLLDRRPRYGCQTGPLWRHKWPQHLGVRLRASSSRRHLVRPQPLQTGRRGLSLGPRCGQHGDTWARSPGCAVQERPGVGATEGRAAFQVETTLAGRTSGRKGRMCVCPGQQEPLPWPRRKEKVLPSGRARGQAAESKGSTAAGRALPSCQDPAPIASQGMDSRGNGQRREITVWSLLAVIPSGENTGSGPDMQEEAQASGQTDRGRPRLY